MGGKKSAKMERVVAENCEAGWFLSVQCLKGHACRLVSHFRKLGSGAGHTSGALDPTLPIMQLSTVFRYTLSVS